MPWLWLEPDCVPLSKNWVGTLAEAYQSSPKRFLGAQVLKEQLTQGPPHMAGPGIYPPDAYAGIKELLKVGDHFDLSIAPYVLPRSSNTHLIQHFWGKPDLAPTFKLQRYEQDPENVLPLAFLRPGAVLFHRCKDGSLINLLRAENSVLSQFPQHDAPLPEEKFPVSVRDLAPPPLVSDNDDL